MTGPPPPVTVSEAPLSRESNHLDCEASSARCQRFPCPITGSQDHPIFSVSLYGTVMLRDWLTRLPAASNALTTIRCDPGPSVKPRLTKLSRLSENLSVLSMNTWIEVSGRPE